MEGEYCDEEGNPIEELWDDSDEYFDEEEDYEDFDADEYFDEGYEDEFEDAEYWDNLMAQVVLPI